MSLYAPSDKSSRLTADSSSCNDIISSIIPEEEAIATSTNEGDNKGLILTERRVTYGNPTLSTYHGSLKLSLELLDQDGFNSTQREQRVAILHVAPDQIPEGILHATQLYRSWIQHLRIFIDETDENQDEFLVLLEMKDPESAMDFVTHMQGKPYTSFDPETVLQLYFVQDFEMTTSTENSTDNTVIDQNHSNCCAVCLEPLGNPNDETIAASMFTTVCNHSFHMDCLLQWQDSPCPVCRYDHAHTQDSSYLLSTCHVCQSTINTYVCLICGLTHCHQELANSNHHQPHATSDSTIQEDSHARQHYNETLHAYALITDTQHVWDFCGQGYVHRLLQNENDGKFVEMNDLYNANASSNLTMERPQNPQLTNEQEDEIIHRKLEGYASQYYSLLQSQLEDQRKYYQGRIEELKARAPNKGLHPVAPQTYIAALKQERQQLSQKLLSLQKKYEKVSENLSFLQNMNESLEVNRAVLCDTLRKVQEERMDCRKYYQSTLPPLRDQVTRLMLQLENQNHHHSSK